MSDPTRALGWWDGTTTPAPSTSFDDLVAGRSARDRAFGLSISEPLSPAGTVKGEHIAQDRACGGIGTRLVVASLAALAWALQRVWRVLR